MTEGPVITPRLGRTGPMAARARARDNRLIDGATGKTSLVRQAAKYTAVRRMRRARQRNAVRKKKHGTSMMARGASIASRGLMANPAGLMMAAGVVSILAVTRAISGRSFENMGAQVRKVLLGDLDEEAAAKAGVRRQLQGNGNLMEVVSRGNVSMGDLKKVFDDLVKIRKAELQGVSSFMESKDFQVNGALDMLILRAITAVQGMFGGANEPKLKGIGKSLHERYEQHNRRAPGNPYAGR